MSFVSKRGRVASAAAILALTGASLAASAQSASAADTVVFGADINSAVPANTPIANNSLIVNNASTANALPAGHVVPAAGVIKGWRIKAAGAGQSTLQFRILRGNTSIHLGPVVDIGAADGVSVTFPESIAVQKGDRIGIARVNNAVATRNIINNSGSTDFYATPLGATETRAPSTTNAAFHLLIQADLSTELGCGGKVATIVGTAGADKIKGTPGDDVIVGLGGKDNIKGLDGNDTICGGDGKDVLKGGNGDDRIFGEAGKDQLKGSAGADNCVGGASKDSFSGCEVRVQ